MSRVITAIIAIFSVAITAWVMTWNKGKKFKIRVKKEQNN